MLISISRLNIHKPPPRAGFFYCLEHWGTAKLTEEQNNLSMSRRTIAIASALSVLALGSLLITGCANNLATNFYNSGVEKSEQGDYQGAIDDWSKAIEIDPRQTLAYYNRGNAKIILKEYQGAIMISARKYKLIQSLSHPIIIVV